MTINKSKESSAILQDLSSYLESYNAINVYSTLFIIIFGVVANLFSLIILLYSRNSLPRIIGCNYLILLTITNTIYLLLQFYLGTYNRLIYHFQLDYDTSLQFLDSNLVCCKLVPYLRYCARLLNTLLTACFSLERLLAVYCPLQIRSFEAKCSRFFKLAILVSFIIPSYLLFLTELVPNSDEDALYERFNISKSFSFNSLTPRFGDRTCSVSKSNFVTLMTFHFILLLIILLSYLFISVSILAIVVRLKHCKGFVFAFRSKASCDYDIVLVPPHNSRNSNESQHQHASNQRRSSSQVILEATSKRRNLTGLNSNSFSFDVTTRKRRTMFYINHKIQNTKMLTSISVSYVLFNSPYFLAMIYLAIFGIRNVEVFLVSASALEHKIKLQMNLVITEIFQLANFSVTGCLFFCVGRIFRLHAFKFFKKIFSCLRK